MDGGQEAILEILGRTRSRRWQWTESDDGGVFVCADVHGHT